MSGNIPPNHGVKPEDLEGDLVARSSPLFGVVWINPDRMSGTPCFFGTRVPIEHLFDYIRKGRTIEFFLEDFHGVTREQVDLLLSFAGENLVPRGRAA